MDTAHRLPRCPWAQREPSLSYHDAEWGTKQSDERMLFELLVLEGAQAGLNWEIILRKRAGYRAAFAGFDPAIVAGFGAAEIERLVAEPGIIRHRRKIAAAIGNAQAFLGVQAEFGTFCSYIWHFTDGQQIVARRAWDEALPAQTALSVRVSADLKRRGFRFVGPTIIYSYLQAIGVVDDHYAGCFRSLA